MCLGIPGQIVEITDPEKLMGMVDVSGVRRAVNLACVVPGGSLDDLIGEWVLVHVGFAMSRIDPDEASATLKALEDLGEAMAEIEAIRDADKMMAG
ncbi:MAG: HypC/HybG/HupF family hydrogenase formation chaperone [Rhodospirillaceae bacterium]